MTQNVNILIPVLENTLKSEADIIALRDWANDKIDAKVKSEKHSQLVDYYVKKFEETINKKKKSHSGKSSSISLIKN